MVLTDSLLQDQEGYHALPPHKHKAMQGTAGSLASEILLTNLKKTGYQILRPLGELLLTPLSAASG